MAALGDWVILGLGHRQRSKGRDDVRGATVDDPCEAIMAAQKGKDGRSR